MVGKRLLHYEILSKLGAGGMGEVYRARDTKLGREVAIKVLSPEMSRDPDRRKRFQREAMAVAALKHPNIVTIYAVEEDGETLFLVMELIEGQALDHLIPPPGMNFMQLLDIAIPVADAVSYAHEKGINHRDLKPGNIMLDEAGRPKVLDFGLAKLMEAPTTPEGATVAADGSVTKEGVVLGTASYMSPEQAEGKPTDSRSDIFSLGIILYEMATGQKPFKGDTTISTISSILKDTPPAVTDLNRSLPNHMGRVVNRCLAKDPSRRYQVALDLRNELEGLREESSSVTASREMPAPPSEGVPPVSRPDSELSSAAPPGSDASAAPPASDATAAPPASAPAGSVGKRNLWLAAAGVVAVGVVLGIWRPWTSGPAEPQGSPAVPETSAATPETGRLMAVVFPFENLGPAEDAYFAAGISEEITSRLSAVSDLGVISRTSATQYDRTGKTMKDIQRDLGVDYVLEGTVRWAKTADGTGRVRITPQLVRASDDVRVWSEAYDREIDDIFEVQSDIAGRVIQELGVTLMASEESHLTEKPTENLAAYQAYLKALEIGPMSVPDWERQKEELLDRAVSLDPGFVKAWYEMARFHSDLYRIFDRTEERLERARRAVQGAEAADPDHPYTRLARGYYRYYGFRDYDQAQEEFAAAAGALPNEAEAHASIGYILRRQGKFEESAAKLEEAVRLDPQNDVYLSNQAGTYVALRRFDEALELYTRAIALAPENDELRNSAFETCISATGDLDRAKSFLNPRPGENPFFYYLGQMLLAQIERDWDRVLAVCDSMDTPNPMLEMFVKLPGGLALERLGREAESRERLQRGLELAETLLEQAPGNPTLREMTAYFYSNLGRKEEAVREAKMAVDLQAKDRFAGPKAEHALATVYVDVGRFDEALEILERMMTMHYEDPMTVHDLRLNPGWDPIREHPGFQELVETHSERLP